MLVNIRQAKNEDYNELCKLFDEVDMLHCSHLPHIFQKSDQSVRNKNYYSELILDDSAGLFVAEIDGKLTGFIHAQLQEAPDIPIFVPRRYTVIVDIGVHSQFQGQGIGKMLMKTAEQWAKEKGSNSIELNVYEFNKTALAFYQSLGYETLSRKMSKQIES
jgi:ribosomal protein S18 acetylase RimI-like enzyme